MKRKTNVVLVMVTSVNGNSTKGSQSPKLWASQQDHKHFQSMLNSHSLLVMGSKTYEGSKSSMKHEKGRLRIVLTRNPARYKKEEIPGQLEFRHQSASALVNWSTQNNYKTMLLLGGSTINSLFFNAGLVDELWLTIEPQLFAGERGLVEKLRKNVSLKLISSKKLNTNGTLLLHYEVIK